MRGRYSDDWFAPRVVLAAEPVVQANRDAVTQLVQRLQFADDEGDPRRTDFQRHQVSRNVPLRMVLEDLLVRMRITGTTDSQKYTGLLLQLSKALEDNADEVCTVYRMSPNSRRRRDIDDGGAVKNFFQGQAPVTPIERRGEIYPGDRAICDADRVTIQIHMVELTRDDRATVVMERVPVITVWVPARLARPWIAQDEQN